MAYKIAAKAVANRMKPVLQEIIGENQSAFVAERLITDNILVAHELMNHISKKKKGKCGEMAIKLDMKVSGLLLQHLLSMIALNLHTYL